MKTILHFDIESTGLEITKDRIIQLSLIKTDIELNIIYKKKKNFNNCGVPIHPSAFEAHKISEFSLESEKPFSLFAKNILSIFNDCDYICGFNIKGFDIQILHEEFSRAGLKWNPKPAIDVGIIFKNRERRTLAAGYKFYCDKEMENAHDAEYDVLTTIEVLKGQIEKYKFDVLGSDSVSSVLVLESKYDNEDQKLTFDGKIRMGKDGIPVWGFGKFVGKPLNDADLGYINWFLAGDFPSHTKSVFRELFNK